MKSTIFAMTLLVMSSPAMGCDDPDAVLSVGDKSKARAAYLRCLIDAERAANSRSLTGITSDVSSLQRQMIEMQGEIRDLQEQILILQNVPYPSK